MRKQTAKQTKRRRTGSSPKQPGLIAKGKNSQQSATTKCALHNRSHRTFLRITCRRPLTSRNIILQSLILPCAQRITSTAAWQVHPPARRRVGGGLAGMLVESRDLAERVVDCLGVRKHPSNVWLEHDNVAASSVPCGILASLRTREVVLGAHVLRNAVFRILLHSVVVPRGWRGGLR